MMHQQGYGLPAYRGIVMQRGYGLGGFFKGLVRAVAPHVKQGLKKVGKKALKTGLQVISDVSEGQNLKQSLKRRATQNVSEFIQQKPAKKRKVVSVKASRSSTGKGKGRKRGRPESSLGIL